jgi:protein TonB
MEITKMKKQFLTVSMITATLAFLAAGNAFAQDTVHVTQAEALKAAKERVEPEYPAMAKQLHLEGAVQLEAHIGENGAVDEVKPLTGNAVLMNSAVAALKRWKFTPFTADGKPVKAVADMSFKFKL